MGSTSYTRLISMAQVESEPGRGPAETDDLAAADHRDLQGTARFSDDQFGVLIAADDEAAVGKFAASIAEKVRGLSIHHPRSLLDRFVTVSHGYATMVPGDAATPAALIDAANEKLLKEFFAEQNLSAL